MQQTLRVVWRLPANPDQLTLGLDCPDNPPIAGRIDPNDRYGLGGTKGGIR
jgi:hypothetical protein